MNKQTKQMKAWYNDYIRYPNRSIYECYTNPSLLKVNAFWNCVSNEVANDGKWGSVISYNTSVFVYAYVTDADFVVITPTKRLTISLREIKQC